MRRSLLLYLFILAVLMNIFTYAYFSRKNAAEQPKTAGDATEIQKLKDSIDVMYNKWVDADYFSLERDQNAQDYIVNNNLDKIVPYDQFTTVVTEQLMSYNDKPEGNPYIGQQQLGERKFIVNKAKLLNHRWLIADYSDGTFWGVALIKYFINEDKTVSFENMESFLYTKQ